MELNYFLHHIAELFQRTNYVFAESTKHFLNVMNEIIKRKCHENYFGLA